MLSLTNKDTMRWIRKDSAWYGVGLIMIALRNDVEEKGGKRITTKMLEDAGIATISKERRRDGEQLVSLENELNEFINSENAPKSITNVTKLLADYDASIKDSANEGDNETETETETETDVALTAEALAASTIKIMDAHGIDAVEFMRAFVDQASPATDVTDLAVAA
jgi:CO dehydrogenase/acetyl-CoA synthase beta subunit